MTIVKLKDGYLGFNDFGVLETGSKGNAIWFDSEAQAWDFLLEYDITEEPEFEYVDF